MISLVPGFRSVTGSLLAATLLVTGLSARAQQNTQSVERIAAVVNDDVISVSDLDGRLRLALLSSGLPANEESRKRLTPDVLRLLIDETLQMQEAKRLKLSVSEDDVDRAIATIASQNRTKPDVLLKQLEGSGVPLVTLRSQLRAQIAWSTLVQRRLQPTISIGDEEIKAYVERIKANAGKPEYLVAEIFLPVDNPSDEQRVRQLAQQLVDQIGRGANFGAVAQQFSGSAGAATGGDIGWIQQGQLEPELDRALQLLKPGQFSKPLRGATGFHILLVRDQRTVTAGDPNEIVVHLRQLILPAQGEAEMQTAFAQAQNLVQRMNGCPVLDKVAQQIPGALAGDLGTSKLGALPGDVARVVGPMGVGVPSQPLPTDKGVIILMVCDRQVPEGSTPPLDAISNQIAMERLDMLQRRYLRDLRRAAVVDPRV